MIDIEIWGPTNTTTGPILSCRTTLKGVPPKHACEYVKKELVANVERGTFLKVFINGKYIPSFQFLERYRKNLRNFGKKRTKVEMTPQRQRDLVKYWNETEGDIEIVAEKLGVSVATVINWGQKIDQMCRDIYRRHLYETNGIDDPESEAAQELENKIMEEGFPSVLCPKKEGTGKRGRSATGEPPSVKIYTEFLTDKWVIIDVDTHQVLFSSYDKWKIEEWLDQHGLFD